MSIDFCLIYQNLEALYKECCMTQTITDILENQKASFIERMYTESLLVQVTKTKFLSKIGMYGSHNGKVQGSV